MTSPYMVLFWMKKMTDDEKWMCVALEEAHKALEVDEIPIGAVIVSNGKIVARAHNMTQALNDSTAHAEMLAITAAESVMGKYLDQCTLYVTLEPCMMCAGALAWSQIKHIIFGASDQKKGYSAFVCDKANVFHPKAVVAGGVMEKECRELLLSFFERKRSTKR